MNAALSLSVDDRIAIEELLFRFMRAFDEKDWESMHRCLVERVYCDYSSFRGTPPSEIARDDYVMLRRTALASLKTQHNLSNLLMSGSPSEAEVKCNYTILRFAPDFDGSPDRFFHSHGQYRFKLVPIGGEWKIASIAQWLLVNEGNPALHGGLRRNSE